MVAPVTKQKLLIAVAGKGAERGLIPEIGEDIVTLKYDIPQDAREDNLHKQSVRALVERMGGQEWKVHIRSLQDGQAGFSVEVRPAPGARVAEPVPIDLTSDGLRHLEDLARQLEEIAKRLREPV